MVYRGEYSGQMQPTERRRTPTKLLLLLSLGVALAAAALAGYIWLPGLILTLATDAPEHSAKYYPRDTIAYGWITLAPRHGQADEARAIWAQLEEHRAFRQLTDDLRDEFEEQFGVDFERDMKEWIGPELSFGVIDPRGEEYEKAVAVTLGVRDREAAEDFVKDWTEHLEQTSWPDFKRESYKGFRVWADQARDQMYLALSDDVLVLTFDQDNMEDIIDRTGGDSWRTSLTVPGETHAGHWPTLSTSRRRVHPSPSAALPQCMLTPQPCWITSETPETRGSSRTKTICKRRR